MDVLEIRDVTAGYGQTTVLRRVSLVVPAGSIVALLGSNGAGKTTLLRTAAGLLRPAAGQVLLQGVDVTRQPAVRRARRGLCLIPEGHGVFRDLSVRDNLRLHVPPGRAKPDADALVAEVVETFPVLGKRLGQVAGSMSGGEQQMLALSRAFVSRPAVVLLDEVSMGLAPKMIDEIFAALRTVAERGVSLLLVEQYVHRALEFAHRSVLLDRGEVVFAGRADKLGRDRILLSYLAAEAPSG